MRWVRKWELKVGWLLRFEESWVRCGRLGLKGVVRLVRKGGQEKSTIHP